MTTSVINSDDGLVSGSAGLKTTGGNDGVLQLQSNGTATVTVTAAGNVGVGTISPAFKFQVIGTSQLGLNSAGTQQVLQLNNSDTTAGTQAVKLGFSSSGVTKASINAAVYGNDYMTFNVGSDTERMRIDSSGNVGIGTSSPSYKLHVVTSGNSYICSQYGAGTQANLVATSGSASLRADNNASAVLTFYTNSAERMRIDSSGNVGVGNSSPSTFGKFVVSGSVASAGLESWIQNTTDTGGDNTRYAGLNFSVGSDNGTSAIRVYRTNSATDYSTNMTFWTKGSGAGATSPTERMRIDSIGRVMINTTSPGVSVASSRLTVNGDYSGSWGMDVNSSSSTGTQYLISFGRGNTQCGSISSSGTNSTSYTTSSDYRLKENVAPMTGALATVSALKPVTYTWKADGSAGQGFIAHELQSIVPDCVTGEKDAVDADNNPVYQGVDTSFLVATLTAAIQEQQAIIESLKSRLDAAGL